MQQGILGYDFDPHHLPDGRFLTGAEAWRRCRAGDDDPERFGIQGMAGWWFIAGSVIRDLAALNKVETHTWDTWGAMDQMFGNLDKTQIELVDEVAATVANDDLTAIQGPYRRPGLTMPGAVTSQRTQQTIHVPAAHSIEPSAKPGP